MSTLKFSIQTQVLDLFPLNRGSVTIMYNDGQRNIPLVLQLTTGVSRFGFFSEVPYSTPAADANLLQMQNFVSAFNRDFSRLISPKNITATILDNEIVVTAVTGTFIGSQSNYDGNVIIIGDFEVDNSIQVSSLELFLSNLNTGNCSTINYTARAEGGSSPYSITRNGAVLNSNWDGSIINLSLERSSGVESFLVTDSNGNQDNIELIVPRQIKASEFKERYTQFDGFSDIFIESVNPVANTSPLSYAITPLANTTGSNYQTSNSFPGILPGLYKLWIRDRYGCEVNKTIQVRDFEDVTIDENPRFFDVMSANSLIFYPCTHFNESTKPNFKNTGSPNELSGLNYSVVQNFVATDFIGTQFKSSYPFHIATLIQENGNISDIQIITVKENLGSREKVDCEFFIIGSNTAVYFDGGNEYEPNTTTIIGNSPYQPNTFNNQTFLPPWAIEGQLVFIDGIGAKYITGTGYDDIRGGYFLVEGLISDTNGIVQVRYNVQPYNLFEFYLDTSLISTKAKIKIEKGFSFDSIDGLPWVSETISKTTDKKKHLLIQAKSSRNRGGMVFQSGIRVLNRLIGTFRPIWIGESETALEDDGKSSLKQSSYQNYRVEFESLTAKQVDKLNIWSGLDGFTINGEGLTRESFPEIEPLEDSNLYSWGCDFASSGDTLSVDQNELVLNVSTGVIGGGSTAKQGVVFGNISPISINGSILSINGKILSLD